MKQITKIILSAIMLTTIPYFDSYSITIDNCAAAGVTEGASCTSSNSPRTVLVSNTCTSASAGCVYKNCTAQCICNKQGASCPGGGSSETNCNGYTCYPNWGTIDYTTHIQTGRARTPDTTNNCKCKDEVSNLYRCIAGYYDSREGMVMIGSKPTCEQCPPVGNNNVPGESDPGVTKNPTNTGITSCYIPYNVEITDNTGTYIFSRSGTFSISDYNGCHYKE